MGRNEGREVREEREERRKGEKPGVRGAERGEPREGNQGRGAGRERGGVKQSAMVTEAERCVSDVLPMTSSCFPHLLWETMEAFRGHEPPLSLWPGPDTHNTQREGGGRDRHKSLFFH